MRRPVRLRLQVGEGGLVAAEVSIRLTREQREARGKDRMCRFVEMGSECFKGENCRYAHSVGELTPEAQKEYHERKAAGGATSWGREPQRVDDLYGTYKTVLCEAFTSEGGCPRGDQCSFAHGEGELREKRRGLSERELFNVEKSSNRICRQWQTTGACPNGAACLFAHGAEQLAKRQAAAYLGLSTGAASAVEAVADVAGGGETKPRFGNFTSKQLEAKQLDVSGDGLECLCLKPYSGCRLWPIAQGGTAVCHTIRPGQSSGVGDCTKTLLGNLDQLCSTFFHA